MLSFYPDTRRRESTEAVRDDASRHPVVPAVFSSVSMALSDWMTPSFCAPHHPRSSDWRVIRIEHSYSGDGQIRPSFGKRFEKRRSPVIAIDSSPKTMRRKRHIPATMPLVGTGAGPVAPLVLTHIRTGPKDSSIETAGLCRQVWMSPTNEIRWSAGVLPIGVRQQLAYQRSRPSWVNRMQTRCSLPWKNVTFA